MPHAQTIRLPSFRFLGLVVLVFLLQLALLFWLSDYSPPVKPHHRPDPRLVFIEDSGGLLRLTDQTMFALPHIESFSGEAWLESRSLIYEGFDWTESPRWLPLRLSPLDTFLAGLMWKAPEERPGVLLPRPEPELVVPGTVSTGLLPQKSSVWLVSASKDFEAHLNAALPSWQHNELIPNSIVQVMANSEGRVVSAVLLSFSSPGFRPADECALKIARGLRISALPEASSKAPTEGLRWAVLCFDWHARVPQTTNNNPVNTP